MLETHEQRNERGLLPILRMSWPASLAMLNTTIVRFVDGLMVSWVSPVAVSAQFFGAITAFVPESFMLGVLSVVSTYVSQNLGARRYARCSQYAWAGLALAFGAAALLAPLAIDAGPLFRLLGHDEWPLEAMYFRYMILAVGVTLGARVLEQFFYGVHRPRVVWLTSLGAAAFNVGANYVLIFGKLGFAPLGLEGAAIGSVTAWVLQFLVLLGLYLRPSLHRRFRTRLWRRVRWRSCGELLRTGWPAGVQICNDIVTWGFGAIYLCGLGSAANRIAATIVMRYLGLSFMPAVGISTATSALVGRAIGAGDHDLARHRAHRALALAVGYMAACGVLFALFRTQMIDLFLRQMPLEMSAERVRELAPQIRRAGSIIFLCAAAFQIFDAIGIIYVGALRGAGDTLWPMVLSIATSWGILLGGGALLALLVPGLQPAGPWIAAIVYIMALSLLMLWRFESGVWRRIDLLGRRPRRLPPPLPLDPP
jgi:MATE family multidrug resistance protein